MGRIALKFEEDFVRIDGSFGVSQHWLRKRVPKFFENRSCALAALANILYYENGELRRKKLTKKEAIKILLELYRLIPPRPWGLPSAKVFYRKFIAYAASKGTKLKYIPFRGRYRTEEVREFIGEGLASDHPVLILTWNHPHRDFHNHWMTVTGMEETGKGTEITVSTWGKRKNYSLEEYLKGKSLHREILYFEKF